MKNQNTKMGINGPWPGKPGVIPVTDGRADDANVITRRYLDSIQIIPQLVGSVKADLTTKIFGKTYASPIMTPAFSHLNQVGVTGRNPMVEYAKAAKQLGVLNWVGMEPDEVYAEIAATGADTVCIIKPFADHDRILEEIAFAISHGAVAVGIDIDHVFGTDGDYDVVDGQRLGPVTRSDLMRYVRAAGAVPFVVKGVLSVTDVMECIHAGVRGIFVSHHHGRVPYAIPPVAALHHIITSLPDVREKVELFVDCHIDTGVDAYKALAMGAKAVSAGRTILPGLLKDGTEGVVKKMAQMNQELAMMMGYTGIPETRLFHRGALYRDTGRI